MDIAHPYLMFLGDVPDALAAKTAHGILDWRREWCLAQLRLPGCGAGLGLPEMDVAEAVGAGARTVVRAGAWLCQQRRPVRCGCAQDR